MNSFAVFLLCVQGLLVQNAYSQCAGRAAIEAPGIASQYGWGAGPLAAPFAGAGPLAAAGPLGSRAGLGDLAYPGAGLGLYGDMAYPAPYGGVGEGNVAVAGELPVAGTTAVTGQVPIMGAVNFGGVIPAAGAVTITGKCACGCGSGYVY